MPQQQLSYLNGLKVDHRQLEAEAEAYYGQPAGTLTPGIGPRWDPWPYICSMSRPLLFFFPFVDLPY
jgi:hypothetical protein